MALGIYLDRSVLRLVVRSSRGVAAARRVACGEPVSPAWARTPRSTTCNRVSRRILLIRQRIAPTLRRSTPPGPLAPLDVTPDICPATPNPFDRIELARSVEVSRGRMRWKLDFLAHDPGVGTGSGSLRPPDGVGHAASLGSIDS